MAIESIDGLTGSSVLTMQEALKKAEEEKEKLLSSANNLMAGNFVSAERTPSRYVQAAEDSLKISSMSKLQAQSQTAAMLDDIVDSGMYNTPAKAKAKVKKQQDAEMTSVLEEQMKQLQEAMKKAEKKRQEEEAAARAQTEGKTQVVVDAETGEISTVTPETASTDMALTPAETTELTPSGDAPAELTSDTGGDIPAADVAPAAGTSGVSGTSGSGEAKPASSSSSSGSFHIVV